MAFRFWHIVGFFSSLSPGTIPTQNCHMQWHQIKWAEHSVAQHRGLFRHRCAQSHYIIKTIFWSSLGHFKLKWRFLEGIPAVSLPGAFELSLPWADIDPDWQVWVVRLGLCWRWVLIFCKPNYLKRLVQHLHPRKSSPCLTWSKTLIATALSGGVIPLSPLLPQALA